MLEVLPHVIGDLEREETEVGAVKLFEKSGMLTTHQIWGRT